MSRALHPHLITITPSHSPFTPHHQGCPPPPTVNYHQMWLNLQFCTYNPPLAFASTYVQQPSLGCTSARHIHARLETLGFLFRSDSGVGFFFSFSFQRHKQDPLPAEEQKDLLYLGAVAFPENHLESLFNTSWGMYTVVVLILAPGGTLNQGTISQTAV